MIDDEGDFQEKDHKKNRDSLDGFNRESVDKISQAPGDLDKDTIKNLLAQVRFASLVIDPKMDPNRAAYKAAMLSVARSHGVYEDEDREDAFVDYQKNVNPRGSAPGSAPGSA